jgi:potassium-transporting ATPase potassium-binding subunit
MSTANWIQLLAFIALCVISTPLLGNYMWKVYRGGKAPGDRFFLPVENAIYRLCGVDPEGEQRWNIYALSLLAFSLAGVLLSYLFLRIQGHLPFNPDHMKGVAPALSFNTAISFLTNTNWQAYGGESTMSHLSQMFALVVQQFLSAAVGMAVAVAFIRALIRRRSTTMGSFWVDVVRSTTRVLLPISFIFAFVFMSQGVIQNFHASKTVTTVASQTNPSTGQVSPAQTIPGGPVASQQSIEVLGDNGGGFFNVNAAHPYENPNPITNVLLYWLVVMIPFAFPWTFGKMVGSMGQGMVILASMVVLYIASVLILVPFEAGGNNKYPAGVSQAATSTHVGGNLEGKDTRLGIGGSTLGAASITATSAGANNSAHESYTPLGGAVPLTNILLGEVSPGGAGAGLFGKLILAMLSVFIAGLMVGRTPEYLGKKVQSVEMKLVVLYIIIVPAFVLVFAGVAIAMKTPDHSLLSYGPYCSSYCQQHGLTEMVYTYASATNSNGSAFAGISANTQWFNSTLGIAMLAGRYLLIIPVLAIGGSLGRKQLVPETAGTFPTNTPLFAGLLVVVTVILVGLVYFPVLALGPIVEHLAGHF